MIQIKLENAIAELKKLKVKRVLLQAPEGLKTQLNAIVEELENAGFEIISEMGPCFGACDIKQSEAKALGAQAVLHLGHTKFLEKTSLPVVYAPLKQEINGFDGFAEHTAEQLAKKGEKNLALTTTAQFLHYLPALKKALEKKGIKAEVCGGKRVEAGQVLGCNYSSADTKAKAILYMGDGMFHPLGIHFATGKKVVIANPFVGAEGKGEVKELKDETKDFMKKRILLIEKAKESDKFAILVSTKEGQNRITAAEKIKKELEAAGKGAVICAMEFISEEKLLGLKVGAYVNTACPRISIDDYAQYKKPMINYNEVPYLLGKKSYENYKLDFIY